MATSSPASSGDALKLPDVDELIEEILAEKGPTKYTGGLSEEKWEEVCYHGYCYTYTVHKRMSACH